uniref:G_PROTEIN_RECEP_F1_2 domain-containing protein n=1 Tax=Rhabditophanes sp. KR3021 TaxID=114890 RepID=A0AC35U3T3_9BILA
MVDHIISSISNFTPIDDSELFFRESGIIPFLPDVINFISPNTTQCVCSDLQHEDYSRLYEVFNFIVIIISLPCVSVCGLASNVVNFYIYSRPSMAKSSSNTYLLALSCSDWLVVITGVFIFWIDSARSYIPALAQAPYSTVYALPFGYMAQTNSIYFTVAAAIDCYFNVCWKNKSSQYCNVKTAKRICIGITICSILYNSLRFPQFNLRLCLHEESQVNVLEICPTTLFFIVNQAYNVYMYMVLMTLLPFMFLLVLNAFIVAKQSTKKNDDQLPHNGLEKKISIPLETSKDESTGDTITLIMVVVLFLLCNFLSLFVNLIETFFEPDPLLLNLLSDASNFLVIFNSSVNSIIYVTFNEKYRQLFKELMYKMKRKIGGRCFSDEKKETKVIKDQTLYFNEVPSSCKEFTSSFKEPSEPSSPIWKPQTVQNQCYSDAHSIYDSEWHGKINDKSRFSCFNADNYELLCPNSQNLSPHFVTVATQLKDERSPIKLATLDSTAFPQVYPDIKRFPTLYFRPNQKTVEYSGEHRTLAIMTWLKNRIRDNTYEDVEVHFTPVEWRRIVWQGVNKNYEVSIFGNVRNFMLKRPLSPYTTRTGYYGTVLKIFNHGHKSLYVHRLIGLAFIDKPENKRQINHLNEIKKDNFVDNLEWVTAQENSLHSIVKEVVQLDENDEVVAFYESVKSAAQSVEVTTATISAYIKNGRSLHGFKWQYLI